MIYLLVAVSVCFAILYVLSRKKYDDFISRLDRKVYALKDFFPIALYILDFIKYRFNTRYDQGIQLKLGELFEAEKSRFYLKIHWANKIALMMAMVMVIAIIGVGMGNVDSSFAFLSTFALILVFYLTDNEINEKLKKRYLLIQIDFPDFLNKLALLINAGMTVSRAMEKIVMDRQEELQVRQRPLYEQLRKVLIEVRGGKPETKAYEDFARRCKVPEITKFASLLIQNSRKGSAELVSILRLLAVECWEMRKNAAKRLGEEASTKLLFPMMIMFLAILLIVISPAAMQLQGF
jgi:tight adherence protein C